jgi:hypothetical protein
MSTFETMPNPGQSTGQLTFDESKFKLRSRKILGQPEVPTMIRFLVTKGFVKTENQAVAVTIGICILLIIATVVIFKSSGVNPAIISPTL